MNLNWIDRSFINVNIFLGVVRRTSRLLVENLSTVRRRDVEKYIRSIHKLYEEVPCMFFRVIHERKRLGWIKRYESMRNIDENHSL